MPRGIKLRILPLFELQLYFCLIVKRRTVALTHTQKVKIISFINFKSENHKTNK